MRERLQDMVEVAGVTAYMLSAAVYLRARGRLRRPPLTLPVVAARASRVGLGRLLGGARAGVLRDVRPMGGFAYAARLPFLLGEPSDVEGYSRLFVLEDGEPLRSGHAVHVDIHEQGGGRFSHWGRYVIFSTSDNTDPRSNGRRYEYAVHE